MGPTWVLSAPDGPHVDPMNLAIWVCSPLTLVHFGEQCRNIWSHNRGGPLMEYFVSTLWILINISVHDHHSCYCYFCCSGLILKGRPVFSFHIGKVNKMFLKCICNRCGHITPSVSAGASIAIMIILLSTSQNGRTTTSTINCPPLTHRSNWYYINVTIAWTQLGD